jgi:predicted esterase
MPNQINRFNYIYTDKQSPRTLLLLHGTGGDENDLLPLGESLDPHANLLSPRGKVLENGSARFFKRLAEGIFDREDLKIKSQELDKFIIEASKKYDFSLKDLIAVGYSNGANIALHLLTENPNIITTAILFRPISAALPDTINNLSSSRILILSGLLDPLTKPEDADFLTKTLSEKGATVETKKIPAGHGLTPQDLEHAKTWLSQNS